ncbi:uncharacterized protein LDX57_004350 [Aspergillus melleus]|uniref:uncharacterized protein n=1 Tax=Aspergillus melleus TaxID=138277 RepID=UPI001E8E09F0|nr:uncharacterized protein LDX57_004350 [Aspergillus melleus]KAH8426615.1 hypothetical protein LDX57_004350 [Aspergillus melleus]
MKLVNVEYLNILFMRRRTDLILKALTLKLELVCECGKIHTIIDDQSLKTFTRLMKGLGICVVVISYSFWDIDPLQSGCQGRTRKSLRECFLESFTNTGNWKVSAGLRWRPIMSIIVPSRLVLYLR